MNVLVTGGAGYIGSHAVRALLAAGHAVTVLDNLTHGHREAVSENARFERGDVGDPALLARILIRDRIEAVLHFAADIEVGESVEDPLKYYDNNFARPLAMLRTMQECGVRRIVFSSTAAVYGLPEKVPITEDQARAPINPYGRSKMMTEMAIEDAARAYGFGYAILRYFNVAGAAADASIGEDHLPESHLIPRILQAALGKSATFGIFGTDYPTRDGTCVRDYIHVEDLVAAHILALEALREGHGSHYNLGSESGFTVREVIQACERVTGRRVETREEPRRPGDPPVLIADSRRIKAELGWEPRYPDLDTLILHAWNWHQSHPDGYRTVSPPARELLPRDLESF